MNYRGLWIATAVGLFAACDAENVQWAFVSNPSGSFGTTGGAVLVIRVSSSSSATSAGDFVRVEGLDDRGAVSVLLPHRGDFGVLSRTGSVELRSPALAYSDVGGDHPGRVVLSGATLDIPPAGGPAALRVRLPDAAAVHPGGVGKGTLHVATSGTLMVLESGAGLVVFGERDDPEVLGLSASLTTTPGGEAYALRLLDGRLRILVAPPLPEIQQRLQQVPSRNSVRLLGPIGEVLAELPSEVVQLQGGAGGLFVQAALPQGLPGDSRPMHLVMATDNRYLLRIDG